MTGRRSRRAVLGAGLALASALAGCSDTGSSRVERETVTPAPVPNIETATPTPRPPFLVAGSDFDGPTITVAHSLSGPARLAGFRSLVEGFQAEHDIGVRWPGGTSISLTRHGMAKRVDRGYPPSVWQTDAGDGATELVARDLLIDIEERVWAAAGLFDAYPAGVRAIAGPDEHVVAVPWAGERLNTLFFNRSVLDAAGVDPTEIDDVAGFRSALETIAAETDATPLSHPADWPWRTGHLFESVLLSQAGPETYRRLSIGAITATEREALRDALAAVASLQPYVSADARDLQWPAAVRRVASGEAATTVCGGRAVSTPAAETGFDADGGREWGHVPFPGTDEVFHFDAPAFVAPRNNPTPERTVTFLRFCASAHGQRHFSEAAGTIPLRTDADVSDLSPFQRGQFDAYTDAATHTPSITTGLTIDGQAYADVLTALFRFAADWDVETTTDRLVAALDR